MVYSYLVWGNYLITVFLILGSKGSAWWTDEIQDTIEERRRAYKKMLQWNVAEEIASKYN